ncbi:MAG: carbohydrate ABC transporter permease [Spirochaetaceae bacterium]
MRYFKVNQKRKLNSISPLSRMIVNIVLLAISLLCIIPLIAVISISFSSDSYIYEHGYKIIPRQFNLEAFSYIFKSPERIIDSYIVSMVVTVLGTVISLILSILIAYPLSLPTFRYRRFFSFFVFFTMLFNGGLVPTYMLMVNYLHLKNTIWAHIIPYALQAFNILLIKTFFQQIPKELSESAYIDGASEIRILFSLVIPLSKPAIATLGLFQVLRYWNDTWWTGMLFIDDRMLITLPHMLQSMLANIDALKKMIMMGASVSADSIPTESARMAMCLTAVAPMLVIFPFFQKYFVKGLTMGSVKG